MQIIIKHRADGTIYVKIDAKRLDFESAKEAKKTLFEIIDNDSKNIILDMGTITYMDSIGLGLIITVYQYIYKRGGEMKLSPLTKQPNEVISIMGLDKLLVLLDCKECILDSGRKR